MADISILARLVNGYVRNVDLTTNTPIVASIKVGGVTNTELTKTILDRLVALQNGSDVDATYHTHDGRYRTETELSSTSAGQGASLIGIQDADGNFTSTNVEGALDELYDALGASAAADVSFDNTASGLTATNVQDAIDEVEGRVDATEIVANAAIPATEKGANNGVATLDAGGKIPVAQLPNSVMEFLGQWDASANDPELEDGTGNAGDVYRVNVAGTQDLGSGSETYAIGDWVMYNGTIWEKAGNSNDVVSVNGQQGVVELDTDDIDEGATNKYFSDAAAQAAVVIDSIADSDTTHAPSRNAVFDALALKQAASANLDEADTFFGATNLTGAEAEQLSDGSNADSLHSHALLRELINAGESYSANVLVAVRWAKAADAGFVAGRAYKADNDASSVDNFYVAGLTRPSGAISAGQALSVIKNGLITSTAHGFTVGAPLFLGASGALTTTAPSATDTAVVRVGMVRDANTIEVQIQVMGIN